MLFELIALWFKYIFILEAIGIKKIKRRNLIERIYHPTKKSQTSYKKKTKTNYSTKKTKR